MSKGNRDDVGRMSMKELEREVRRLREDRASEYKRGFTAGRKSGYDEGWRARNKEQLEYIEPLNSSFNILWGAIHYTYGVATAGFGQITLETLKELGGNIGKAVVKLEFDVTRIEERTGEDLGLELSEPIAVVEALKAMYSGSDSSGSLLRAVAAKSNPTIEHNMNSIRPMFAPGGQKKDIIDRLCDRAKKYRDNRMSWEDTHTNMVNELDAIQNRSDDENEEFKYLEKWTVDSLKKSYNRRADKLKLLPNLIGT